MSECRVSSKVALPRNYYSDYRKSSDRFAQEGMSTKVAPYQKGDEYNELPLPQETKERDSAVPSNISEHVRLRATRLETTTKDSRPIVNISTYLDSIWPKYDLDKDGQLNSKELRKLFKDLSQRPITEENVALFLESVGTDENNLVDKSEMVDFITMGLSLNKPARIAYASTSDFHENLINFFMGVDKQLLKVKLTVLSSNEQHCLTDVAGFFDSLWAKFDRDRDGYLDVDEVIKMFHNVLNREEHIGEADAYDFLLSVDSDKNGKIEKNELLQFIETGLALNHKAREKYAERGAFHKTVIRFFDAIDRKILEYNKSELDRHTRKDISTTQDYKKLTHDDLAKLVPIFLEDSADGNEQSIAEMLNLDSKTDQFSILEQTDEEGRTAFHKAGIEGRFEVLKLLCDYVKENPRLQYLIDLPDVYGSTPFFLICMKLQKSDAEQAAYLLHQGARVDIVKKATKESSLHWVAYHGSVKLVDIITSQPDGTKLIYSKNSDGRYPMDVAGDQYMRKVYDESDIDVGDSILPDFLKGSDSTLYTLLMKYMLQFGDDEHKTLLEYQNRRLYWACVFDDTEHALSALLNHATSNYVNVTYKSQNAFHAASRHGSENCLKILLKTAHAKEAMNARDNDGNTPLIDCVRMTNFAAKYRQSNFPVVKLLLAAGADDMCFNKQYFRAANFAKSKQLISLLEGTSGARKRNEELPPISWDWVLVFASGIRYPGLESQYEKTAKWLRAKGLIVDVFGSALDRDEVFVCVDTTDAILKNYAEKFGFELPMLADRECRPYKRSEDHLFAPFKTQERMEVTMLIIEDALDIDAYLAGGVIKRVFPVHDESELNIVRQRWVYAFQPFASFKDYVTDTESNNLEDINHVRSYYGEKIAFYYTWFCQYTSTLTMLVPFSIATSSYQLATGTTTSGYLAFYAIVLVLWSTYQGEMWRRKQEELAYRWDMLDFAREEKVRPEFKGDESINRKTGFVEKYYPEEMRRRKKFLSIPMLAFFSLAVFAGFVAVQVWRSAIGDPGSNPEKQVLTVVASTAYAFLIIMCDVAWKQVAMWLTNWENHRTDSEMEDAYVFKRFVFMLINNTMAAFYTAFVERDIVKLYSMMFSLILVKSVSNVFLAVTIPYFKTWPKRLALKKLHAEIDLDQSSEWGYVVPGCPGLTKRDVLEARLEVAENDSMETWKGTDDFFAELMIQYAFVVFFTPAFPLAPVVAWVVNIIGMRLEMVCNTTVMQRAHCRCARDIGSWQTLQEGLSLVSSIIIVGLLLFTMRGELGPMYKRWFPTYDMTMWSLIVLEHILLLTKIGLSAIIDDRPAWVVEAVGHHQFQLNMQREAKREANRDEEESSDIML